MHVATSNAWPLCMYSVTIHGGGLHDRTAMTRVQPTRKTQSNAVARAFSYIRFSSKRQAKGESFRRQMEFALEVCAENGWTLDETLTMHDLGVSAYRGANAKVGAL